MTVVVAVRERAHARWPVAGMPLGLVVLRTAPERALTAMIGAAVLVVRAVTDCSLRRRVVQE